MRMDRSTARLVLHEGDWLTRMDSPQLLVRSRHTVSDTGAGTVGGCARGRARTKGKGRPQRPFPKPWLRLR
jgi:hypothetical protein